MSRPLLHGTNPKYDDTFNAMVEHIESRRRGNRKRGAEFRDVDPDGRLRDFSDTAVESGQVWDRRQLGPRRQQRDLASMLSRLAQGEQSFSAEQLRQGLQQNLAAQQSMAASARPQDAAMAARTAAIQSGQLGGQAAGQQALAGIAERQAAAQGLSGLLGNMRQQDIQSALGQGELGLRGILGEEGARGQRFGALAGLPTTNDRLWTAFGQALPVVGAAFGS